MPPYHFKERQGFPTTMYQRSSQSDDSSQLSVSTNDSLVNNLRDQGLEPESLRFADVSVYIDPDGNRYRIERVGRSNPTIPSNIPSTRRAAQSRAPLTETRALRAENTSPSADNQRITNRSRPTRTPGDTFPSPPGQPSGGTRYQNPPSPPLQNHEFNYARTLQPSNIYSAPSATDNGAPWSAYNIDQTVANHDTPGRQLWQTLEGDAPRLELSPVYSQPQQPPLRYQRTFSEPSHVGSPVSVLGTNRSSNVSVPYAIINGIDLVTPIVVGGSETSTMSGESVARGTETPGERLLLDMDVAISMKPQSDFVASLMRVFVNTGTDDLRFYIVSERQGNQTVQSFRVHRSNTDFVPIYGYSPSHIRVICIKEILRRRKKLTHNQTDQQQQHAPPSDEGGGGLSIYCDFHTMQDLFEFQKKLLDEEVFLDIERARYMKIVETSLHSRQIDAPRIQIWREGKSDTALFDDNMSHYTAGTMLSGPMRDRVAPTTARLFIYLGRSEEYMSIFITDDVTLQEKGSTKLLFTATKSGLLRSRTSIQCLHAPRASQTAAGIKLDKAGLWYEEQSALMKSYKSFEIELENMQNRLVFVETWNKVLQARRRERMKLKAIEEEVSHDVYTGKTARKIIM